jgi:hypothetical protein
MPSPDATSASGPLPDFRRRKRAPVFLAAALALALPSSWIRGHWVHYPKQDRLRFTPDRVEATLLLILDHDEEVGPLRDRFDRDASGRLEEAEREELVAHMAREIEKDFALRIGREPAALLRTAVSYGGLDAAKREHQRVEVTVVLEAKLPPGPVLKVAVSDRPRERRKAVPLTLVLEGWECRDCPGARPEPAARRGGAKEFTGVALPSGKPWHCVLRRSGAKAEPPLESR